MRSLLLAALLPLAACSADEPASPAADPVSPEAPIGDPAAPADSVLADSVNYQPVPGPIPNNATLPDTAL